MPNTDDPVSNTKTSKYTAPKTLAKERTSVLKKDVIYFKCHGHGHYKNECPNARAITQREWYGRSYTWPYPWDQMDHMWSTVQEPWRGQALMLLMIVVQRAIIL